MLSDDRHLQIQHLIDINRYAQAKQLTQTCLIESPSDPTLYYFLSFIYLLEDDHESGIESAEAGLASEPKDEDLRHVLFQHLYGLKQFADSELIIIDLIHDNPRNSVYLADYAELMLFTFHIQKARELANEALRIDPTCKSAKLIDVLIDITRGNLDNSEQTLQKLIANDPEGEQVLRLLLVQLVEKKRYEGALVLTQQLLRRNPLDAELIDLIIDLRAMTHWSAIPLWPMRKLGLMGTFLLWISFVTLVIIERYVQWPNFIYVVYAYLGYCLFSWIHEPIVRRIIKARGI